RGGFAPWLAVAREELAQLDPGVASRSQELSDVERKIVDLIGSGATNREISAAVFLSVKAVEARLSRLYRRFGVRNRAELLVKVASESDE
ncbi:MAG: response regulator transcription factor, partial [Stackebrandtia sp.]